jgi:hypothetical protein
MEVFLLVEVTLPLGASFTGVAIPVAIFCFGTKLFKAPALVTRLCDVAVVR